MAEQESGVQVVPPNAATSGVLHRKPTQKDQVVATFGRMRAELRTLEGTPYYDTYQQALELQFRTLQAGWCSLLVPPTPK